jgi:23S rRNA pseudouridine1911/1915/1917 synthase
MAYINHPVVGDPLYSNFKEEFKLKGQLLHAGKIVFNHPVSGKHMEFTCDIPEYFKRVLKILDIKEGE